MRLADSRDLILAALSRAGITVAEIERSAGIGHGTLNKALEGNRNLSLDHFRAVLAEVARRDREAAKELLDWFAGPCGFLVVEAPGGKGGRPYPEDVRSQLGFVAEQVEVYSDGIVDRVEFEELHRNWRSVASRIEGHMDYLRQQLKGKRAVTLVRVAA